MFLFLLIFSFLKTRASKLVTKYVKKTLTLAFLFTFAAIELLNNKPDGLSLPGGFSSLLFDQVVPYYSQRHLADWNAIYILHR
jgi:hypothetical protein